MAVSNAGFSPSVPSSPLSWGTPVSGAPIGALPFILRQRLAEHPGPLLHVCRDNATLQMLQTLLDWLMPETEILRFPAWDCLPYDRVSPHGEIVAERVATLQKLMAPAPASGRLVLSTPEALMQRVPPRSFFSAQGLIIRSGDELDPQMLGELLGQGGYVRVDTVMERGEFAVRGSIFDFFPADGSAPVRLDLFGDVVENIRDFDPVSQLSGGRREQVSLAAASEYAPGLKILERFRQGWAQHFGVRALGDPLAIRILEGQKTEGAEHYLPLLHGNQKLETLFDYLPEASLSFEQDALLKIPARLELIQDYYEVRASANMEGESLYRPLPPETLYLDGREIAKNLKRYPVFIFEAFAGAAGRKEGADAGYQQAPIFSRPEEGRDGDIFDAFLDQAAEWEKQGKKVYLTAWSRGGRERLGQLMAEHGKNVSRFDSWSEAAKLRRGTLGLLTLELPHGFVGPEYVFITEEDLLGEKLTRPRRSRRRDGDFINRIGEIGEGDLVVHEEYGIGRYSGLETVVEGRVSHDYLVILYDGEQRLLLPVENISLLSRFGADMGEVQLDRLGGVSWQARKAKMKTRLREMAGELMRTAALRAMKEVSTLVPESGAWEEFCARFPYAETDDQLYAISDVLEDLGRGVPMDRLICGDVGFGKTEVALRAAFVTAMNGMQVAVIVPTTLLARQHYQTFLNRFAGFPVKIAQLSRLVSASEAVKIRRGLAEGTIDIVVGTHALLSRHLKFNRLGLLIIDEEQHFGVGHKEKLKTLREDVHVLTLSATPLPRTLQLSLSGMREMSLIATPPMDRLAVRTFIMPFDSVMIREAIQRERFRGGQVFCVVPRLSDMDRLEQRLRQIVPDARIARAHGQLAPQELEDVMAAFAEEKYDILLSTNIVESGLDMPRVNTIVIYRADCFGLGQLYQLRGRVGRGKQRGYAYLTWPQDQELSSAARRRLEIMDTLDTLGAGFTLASHDLDMRGAGNLLGEEQSGHIREVGVELYQQMLSEAVADLKNRTLEEKEEADSWTPQIILGLPVLLPETYIADLSVRLGLYRRIGSLSDDAEIEQMQMELMDRFGKIPEEVSNLLEVVRLKRLCLETGVERIEAGPRGMVVTFRNNVFSNPEGLLAWAQRKAAAGVRIRPDQKLGIVREMTNKTRIPTARKVLGILAKLQKKKQESPTD